MRLDFALQPNPVYQEDGDGNSTLDESLQKIMLKDGAFDRHLGKNGQLVKTLMKFCGVQIDTPRTGVVELLFTEATAA